MSRALTWLAPEDPAEAFPPPDQALEEPAGLLAAGGDLSAQRLIAAYRRGIFPWYSPGQPILWWSPDPREVLYPEEFVRSRSLRRTLRSGRLRITQDAAFEAVIAGCAAPRAAAGGTWITPQMRAAYVELYRRGIAHSVEAWQDGTLVGGLYGIRVGPVFCGESMFSRVSDASKAALASLVEAAPGQGIELIDCQMPSAHLRSLGSRPIPRKAFLRHLEAAR
jgi:leucyl/phenylalanyl-tRNA---protein transferase